MYALAFVFNTLSNRMMVRIASNMVMDIRGDIDRKMHRMKLNYYDTHTNGEILSTVTNDVDAINILLGKNLFQIISAVITIIGILVMLLTINIWLALVAVVMVPVTLIATFPIMKRGGYDMVLSKGAENISQGQRQLLTIARAIIADPEIMILDEATSNVDAHTEQAIQNAMAVLMKGRTSFVIAHRLSTIRDANVILYMENGDIKEVGDHDTLIKKNGRYAVLYNSQFG